jgi:hypothetical protein
MLPGLTWKEQEWNGVKSFMLLHGSGNHGQGQAIESSVYDRMVSVA